MAGYSTRQSTYTDGDVINAADSNDEFDQILAAFNASTGHNHDGTAGEGSRVTVVGTAANNVTFGTALTPDADNTIDIGTSAAEFKDLYLDGVAYVDSIAMPTTTVTDILDEDAMTSNSASALATQQSIKAYVDAQVTAQDLDFQADTGGALNIDLDSESLTFTGGTGIDTSGSGNAVTFAIDSTVATLTDTQTLTNKTLTAPVISTISNTGTVTLPTSTDTLVGRATTDTLTNKTLTSPTITTGTLNGAVSGTSIKDEDDMTSDSASHLATQQSIKAYVDAQVATKDALSELSGDSDDITEGTTNLFFTNERVDDRVNGLLTAGSNITLTYDDTANTLTVAATEDDLSNNDTDDLSEGTSNLYFTNERVDDRVNDLLTAGSNITLTYDDTANTLTVAATDTGITDVVDDTTPQLGGDLDTNGNLISFPDSASSSADRLKFGTGNDSEIYHTGTTTFFKTNAGATTVIDTPAVNIKYGAEFIAEFSGNNAVSLYYDNSKKFETTSTGVTVTGTMAATSVTGDGSGLTNLPETGDGGIAMAIALG